MPAVSGSTVISTTTIWLKLKFIDIDINTLNYNLHDLENAITENQGDNIVNLLGTIMILKKYTNYFVKTLLYRG